MKEKVKLKNWDPNFLDMIFTAQGREIPQALKEKERIRRYSQTRRRKQNVKTKVKKPKMDPQELREKAIEQVSEIKIDLNLLRKNR